MKWLFAGLCVLLLVGCESRLDRNTHLCGLYKARAISLKELETKLEENNVWSDTKSATVENAILSIT